VPWPNGYWEGKAYTGRSRVRKCFFAGPFGVLTPFGTRRIVVSRIKEGFYTLLFLKVTPQGPSITAALIILSERQKEGRGGGQK